MTTEEAISILETNAINATGTLGSLPPTAAEKSSLNRQIEALDMAISALEKQIPKKPIYNHYEDGDKGEPEYIKITCPNGCDIQLHPVTDKKRSYEDAYCPKCGQLIDWSEKECIEMNV